MTSWRVLVVVVAAVIAVVVAGTVAVRAQIRSRTLDSAVDSVAVISSVVIDRNLTFSDVTQGMNPENRAELTANVISLKRRGEVRSLTIWSLSTGRLVYSDADPGDEIAPSPDATARAREGEPFVVTDADHPEHPGALVVYNPYDANGDGTMDAVAEVVVPSEPVTASIARSTGLLYLGSIVVLLLAVAGILRVRRHQIQQDHAAVHDALTGLGNRTLLHRMAPGTLAGATAESQTALLLIDLDNFKAVNDTLGHHAGDELLIAVAGIIQEASGPDSVAVRLGGDEFAVLLPQVSDHGQARTVADQIRNVVRRPLMVAGHEVEVNASVGLAWAPGDSTELSALIRRGDIAMYWAKRSGAGVAEYGELAQTAPPRPRATTLLQLCRALADQELELFYQPARAANGTVTTVEALARWRHPERGLLDASAFIPAVAHTSLDAKVTEWVLQQAARQCALWRAGGMDLTVSVNISARSLYSEALVGLVRAAADGRRLPMSALELEVAEAVVAGEQAMAVPAMRRLHDAGVSLCMDNFGAVYGAISTITEVPLHRLKINRKFGGDVAEDPLTEAAVSGWVSVAHQLGFVVTAQAVETAAAWRQMTALGCDEAQGHGICSPMPAAELTRWLSQPALPPPPDRHGLEWQARAHPG